VTRSLGVDFGGEDDPSTKEVRASVAGVQPHASFNHTVTARKIVKDVGSGRPQSHKEIFRFVRQRKCQAAIVLPMNFSVMRR
jgi:hypothetical protein